MKIKTIAAICILCLMNLTGGLLYAQAGSHSHSLNSYSFDLYRASKIDNENLLISPLSTIGK